jgi:hypothetical protein
VNLSDASSFIFIKAIHYHLSKPIYFDEFPNGIIKARTPSFSIQGGIDVAVIPNSFTSRANSYPWNLSREISERI